MDLDSWTEPWPRWANRWWGVVARVLLVGLGIYRVILTIRELSGTTNWGLEEAVLIGMTALVLTVSIAMAIRPSQLVLLAFLLGLAIVQGLGD